MKRHFVVISTIFSLTFNTIYPSWRVTEENYKKWDLKHSSLYNSLTGITSFPEKLNKLIEWFEIETALQKLMEKTFQEYDPANSPSYAEFKVRRAAAIRAMMQNGNGLEKIGSIHFELLEHISEFVYPETTVDCACNEATEECRKLFFQEKERTSFSKFFLGEQRQKELEKKIKRLNEIKDLQEKLRLTPGVTPTPEHLSALNLSPGKPSQQSSTPENITNLFKQYFNTAKTHVKKNIGYYLAGAVIISYSVTLLKLIKDTMYMKDEDAWFAFGNYMTPEALIMSSPQETREELLQAIKKRYNFDDENLAQGLQQFMEDTKKEIKRMKSFVQWHEWLEYLLVDVLFPAQEESVKQAQVNIIKLEYLQQLMKDYQEAHSKA